MTFFLLQIVAIHFLSKITVNEIFFFLKKILKNNRVVFIIISIIFFPGTVIHELSHFFAAIILFLRVGEVRVIPFFEKNTIKLGSVIFEKKDFVRSLLVGIAPLLSALIIFYTLSLWNIFPNKDWRLNILFGYLIFVISSTMFSSKQDLIDWVYIVPLVIIIGIVIYVLDIKIIYFIENFKFFFDKTNYFLSLSAIINIGIFVVLKFVNNIFKNA